MVSFDCQVEVTLLLVWRSIYGISELDEGNVMDKLARYVSTGSCGIEEPVPSLLRTNVSRTAEFPHIRKQLDPASQISNNE